MRPGFAADHPPPSNAAVMEEQSSTHPLGHIGPVTGSLYLAACYACAGNDPLQLSHLFDACLKFLCENCLYCGPDDFFKFVLCLCVCAYVRGMLSYALLSDFPQIIITNNHMRTGFGGLWVACWPVVHKFAG